MDCVRLEFVIWLLFSLFASSKGQNSSNDAANFAWYIWLIIALGFSIAVILLGASIFYIIHSCRKMFKPKPRRSDRVKDIQLKEETDFGRVNFQQLGESCEMPREEIKLVTQLGIGEFGPIYDAEVKLRVNSVSRALVKVFQQGTNQDLVNFREDIEELMRFEHPQVAKLFGVVSRSPFYIVMELTVNGDLKSFLLASQSSDPTKRQLITFPQLIAMAADVATGLAYLESLSYVHKDIAARSCMVTQSLGVKIADYKVGRFLFRSEYAVQADGSLMPLRWMAPESIQRNLFNLYTSVWSFGVLMWEVTSRGFFPYAELDNVDVVTSVCQEQYKLPAPADCPDQVYQIMLKCWANNPKKRPNMESVRRQLESSILTNRYTPLPYST